MNTRFNYFWAFTASIILFFGCTTSKHTSKTTSIDFFEIDSYLQSLIDSDSIPGIAVAITRKRNVVYSKAFGVTSLEAKEKLQPWNTFHIASISKTFVATAIMQLYENGKIDINKPLVTYLSYFKLNDERYKLITIKQMLNHTSGMPDVKDYEWRKAVADEGALERYTRSLANIKMISDPGSQFHYSNIAFEVLGDVIAKVSGMSFETYVKNNIFIPLEMYESSFYLPDIKQSLRTSPHVNNPPMVSAIYPYNRMHAPSSTLNTNILELSHWAIVNLYEGKYKGKRILSKTTHSLMLSPTFQMDDTPREKIGLSWEILTENGRTSYIHSGKDLGYLAWLELLPEQKIGLIILFNCDGADIYRVRTRVIELLLKKYANARHR